MKYNVTVGPISLEAEKNLGILTLSNVKETMNNVEAVLNLACSSFLFASKISSDQIAGR